MYKKADEVLQNCLCTGCGTCVGICPTEALTMQKSRNGLYIPVLFGSKCNNCNLCIEVCPGASLKFKEMQRETFNRLPNNPVVGNFLNCYLAHSCDPDMRLRGQSGGTVSSLLLFALEEGLIDGAVVSRMSIKNPLLPEIFIAKNRKEIMSASGSKYCPVPANILIKQVLAKPGQYAVVGIPCQMHGIRKAEKVKKVLKKKIKLHFGLFCDRTLNFLFQDYVLSKINAEKQDVQDYSYIWPNITIRLKNGKTKNLSQEWRINAKSFFTPERCYLCFDKLNELADISFGDARRGSQGVSMVITRTKAGEDVFRRAQKAEVIKTITINIKDVITVQKPDKKKLLLNSYLRAFKLIMGASNYYDVQFSKEQNNKIGDLIVYIDYLLGDIPKNPFAFKQFRYAPLMLLKSIAFIRRRIFSFVTYGKEIENPYLDDPYGG